MFDFGLQEQMVFIIRIIATVGSAVVGWFVSDPLTRLTYRLSFRAATPIAVLFTGKTAGAALLACAVWFLMPTGGGGGGFGFGPGQGGAPGQGAGKGGSKSASAEDPKNTKDKTEANKSPQNLEPVEIEIVSGKAFKDDGSERYFLIKRAEPALTRDQLDDYLKKNRAKIEVIPVLTKESIGVGREDNPLSQLLALTKKYDVKTLRVKTP